jgi:hypothetical protein
MSLPPPVRIQPPASLPFPSGPSQVGSPSIASSSSRQHPASDFSPKVASAFRKQNKQQRDGQKSKSQARKHHQSPRPNNQPGNSSPRPTGNGGKKKQKLNHKQQQDNTPKPKQGGKNALKAKSGTQGPGTPKPQGVQRPSSLPSPSPASSAVPFKSIPSPLRVNPTKIHTTASGTTSPAKTRNVEANVEIQDEAGNIIDIGRQGKHVVLLVA